MTRLQESDSIRHMRCPECGRVASVPEWCKRPICVHAWSENTPEVWDGDDVDGDGRPIEWSPHEPFRVPGRDTWVAMVSLAAADVRDASVMHGGRCGRR